jgi:hypothetical protein
LCFEEFLIGRLTINLPLTLAAASIYIGLIIRGGKDQKPYKRVIITLITLTGTVLTNRKITKHNFGGIFTNIMSVLILATLVFYYGCRACCKHRKIMPWKTLLVLMIVSIFYARYRYTYMVEHSCDRWTHGLSMNLDQSDKYCHIEEPTVCHAEILHRVLDLSLYFDTVNCENQETAKTLILQYYKTEKRYVGLPLTKEFTPSDRYEWPFRENVSGRAKGYNSMDEAKANGHEFIIDWKQSKVNINLERNSTLVEERT